MKKFFTFVAAAFAALTLNAANLTVAEAIEEGMKLDSAATSEADFTVEGFVINAQPFSISYGNQIWYMADAADATESDFQAYGCVAVEGADTLQVLNGDKVALTGKLFKYWNRNAGKFIIEIKNGTAAFVSKAEGDHSIDKGVEQISVAKALELGAALEKGATSTKTYEITGYISAMAGKEGDFDKYGNQTYWIADEQGSTAASNAEGAFEVYRGKADQEVQVGYKVKVKTAIKKYDDGSDNGLIESETNAAVTILEGGEPVEEDADVVFGKDDFAGKGTEQTGSEVVAEKDGVTFTCDKAYGDGQYGVRCYKGSSITITSATEQIGKIVFEFGLDKTGGLDAEIIVNAKEWSAENLESQARLNKISIYFGEFEPEEDTIPELPEGVLNCAMAVEMAAEAEDPTADNKNVEVGPARVRGFVTFCYDAKDGKQSAWIADSKSASAGVVQGYYLEVANPVAKGDYVELNGTLVKYFKAGKDGKPDEIILEVTNGTMAKVSDLQGIEEVVLTEKAQKVVVDGVLYIVRDNKMFNIQGAQVR